MLAGCASTEFKGTPFYTGEYAKRVGEASDRVNLWPILYYRKPALSVLWPLIEVTDEHVAIRPVFSVYGTDSDKPVYNVIWPLAQFDTRHGDSRVFPVFWGSNYAVVFPLYWHRVRAASGEVLDGFFPLWWYRRDRDGFDLDAALPVFHVRKRLDSSGWRVWPLAGSYSGRDGGYSFYAWPLGHAWRRRDAKGSALAPVYWYQKAGEEKTFYSLPYSFHRGRASAGNPDWDFVPPLLYRASGGGSTGWGTPLFGRGGSADGTERWSYAVPLYFRRSSPLERLLVTPLGGRRATGTGSSWAAIPVLSWGERRGEAGSVNVLGPLARWQWDRGSRASYVFPLFYRSLTGSAGGFYSLPWSAGRDGAGTSWQLAFPLMFRRVAANGNSVIVTPLFAAGRGDGNLRWHTVIPFYYRKTGNDGRTLATILGGFSSDASGHKWLLYPLLSGGRKTASGGDLWLVAPLFHAAWGQAGASSHLLPLYYWDGVQRVFVSPLAARWSGADGASNLLVPPLLSYYSEREKRKDLWAAAGLARWSWGEEKGPRHLFPLFYQNPGTGTFVTPLFAGWKDGPRSVRVIPPLLSGWSSAPSRSSSHVVAAMGLYQRHRDRRTSWSYLFPLYFQMDKDLFLTPLFGWNKDEREGFFYPLTPLAGGFSGGSAGGWLFPLFSHRREKATGRIDGTFLWGSYHRSAGGAPSRSSLFPVYSYENLGRFDRGNIEAQPAGLYGKRLICLPGFWYSNRLFVGPKGSKTGRTLTMRSGCFPLWSYSRSESGGERGLDVRSSVLLLLYDYMRRQRPDSGQPDETREYVRSRVLWRVWHCERSGDDVSVDVFPGVTYDRRGKDFRKTSFLWRVFRYERDGKARRVDLLFVPVLRTGKGEKAEPES
jgi:hypothetical protein